VDVLQKIIEKKNAIAFFSAAFADGQQLGKTSPCREVLWISKDVRRSVEKYQPRTYSKLEFRQRFLKLRCYSFIFFLSFRLLLFMHVFQSRVRTHNDRNRIAVGNPDADKAKFSRPLHQFLRMRCPTQKREIASDCKFGIKRLRRHGFDTRTVCL